MNNQDILLQVSSRLDNSSLERLPKTSLWILIREFAQDQYFWSLRVQHLLGRETSLQDSRQLCWKRTYYSIAEALSYKNHFGSEVLRDASLVRMIIEAGYDPSAEDNLVIKNSSMRGYHQTVRILLEDKRIDPSVGDNYPIRVASNLGYHLVVELLLADERVDPTAQNNYAIKNSTSNGHIKVIELLKRDSRIKSTKLN